MSTDALQELCQSASSIAAELAKDPSRSVNHVVKRMRSEWKEKEWVPGKVNQCQDEKEKLDWAEKCGTFPYRPSDLFLKVYADVLDSISRDPFTNLVSPSLMGSSGVIPLSIVSVIPDIMRHYADLILHAQHEVFLATNYWENSHSSGLVADALRALSKRAIEEGKKEEEKVVVKVMYDRGTPKQVVRNHSPVPPSKWDSVGLPRPEDIKGIRMEVLNYHCPPLGTFHAKYLIVDRKVACVNSNNIQDRPNVEMCVHLEGPIVESFYDVALFSWANKMDRPLPLLSKPPKKREEYKFGEENEHLKYIDTQYAGIAARALLAKQHEREARQVEGAETDGQQADGSLAGQVVRTAAGIHGGDEGVYGKDKLIGEHPAMNLSGDTKRDSGIEIAIDKGENEKEEADGSYDERQLEERQERPRTPSGQMDGSTSDYDETNPSASSSINSSNSDFDSPRIGPEVLKSEEPVNYNSNTNSSSSSGSVSKSTRVEAITKHLNGATLNEKGTADDDESMDEFQPHIMHGPHEPVPIAMVNRAPRGTPGHENVKDVPQDIAWLSLIKHAKETIFIQTPTFNASPLIPATLDACRRGVEVTLYLDLGFNDLGEMIPFQGGTNEQVVHGMYNVLNNENEGKAENLKVYWYTAKDQKEPVSATRRSRNCHVKFMAVDSQVTMLGNGNQDTQSWFHSQETNVLIDSPQLTHEWLSGINSNQNTQKFGLVDKTDGVWRAPDGSGRVVQSSGVKKQGPIGQLKGVTGAVRRVRGTGGF